jgi:hypothetical protein
VSEPTVIAQAGVQALQQLQRVLSQESIEAEIICPPDSKGSS